MNILPFTKVTRVADSSLAFLYKLITFKYRGGRQSIILAFVVPLCESFHSCKEAFCVLAMRASYVV